MREILKALQAGEITVSRAEELLDIFAAGNYTDELLPPVRDLGLDEDTMAADEILRLRAEVDRITRIMMMTGG